MKSIHGLILAIGLGIAAAVLNFAYLNVRSQDEQIGFLGIAADATLARGERLSKENLVKVSISVRSVGNLGSFAVRYEDLQTVVGSPVWRPLEGGSLLLLEDLKTPPQELKLGENERAMFVPIDSRAFVPKLVAPGCFVDFVSSRSMNPSPTPAVAENPGEPAGPRPAADISELPALPSAVDSIGPFEILALGNRLGSSEVSRAYKTSQVQENILTIRVKVDKNGRLEAKAQALRSLLDRTQGRGVSILLYPNEAKPPADPF